MADFKNFISKQDESDIVEAIKTAEKESSGEIRVHIEAHTDDNHYEHAKEVFEQLKMHETKLRNGVLFYLAVNDHKFVILGDQGINNVVPENFWDETKEMMQLYFRNGEFKKGLIEGILKAGTQLKNHFPYSKDDTNELSNQISKSK